jgi:hypothetical protein
MSEYLRAVAEAAPVGLLDGAALHALDPGQAIQRVEQVKGLNPLAAELVVVNQRRLCMAGAKVTTKSSCAVVSSARGPRAVRTAAMAASGGIPAATR